MREICCSFGVIDQLPISADAKISLKIDNSTWAFSVPATPGPAKNSRPVVQTKLLRGMNPRWGESSVPSFKRSYSSSLHTTEKIVNKIRLNKQYSQLTVSFLGCLMSAAASYMQALGKSRKTGLKLFQVFLLVLNVPLYSNYHAIIGISSWQDKMSGLQTAGARRNLNYTACC